jgi:hypothetical protein
VFPKPKNQKHSYDALVLSLLVSVFSPLGVRNASHIEPFLVHRGEGAADRRLVVSAATWTEQRQSAGLLQGPQCTATFRRGAPASVSERRACEGVMSGSLRRCLTTAKARLRNKGNGVQRDTLHTPHARPRLGSPFPCLHIIAICGIVNERRGASPEADTRLSG